MPENWRPTILVKATSVLQTPTFKKAVKKLKPNQKQDLDLAVKELMTNPSIGEQKKGNLAFLRVHKFKMNKQFTLLGYSFDDGALVLELMALAHTKISTAISNGRSDVVTPKRIGGLVVAERRHNNPCDAHCYGHYSLSSTFLPSGSRTMQTCLPLDSCWVAVAIWERTCGMCFTEKPTLVFPTVSFSAKG